MKAAALLREASRVVLLTGAGISTESGIPDFRSPGGLWSRFDPAELSFDRFCVSAATRRLYWEIACESYEVFRKAQPNAAHRAVAAIEAAGKLLCLVTQNVDGLHQRAGSSDARLIEIHGSGLRVKCINCEREHDRELVHRRVLGGEAAPSCDDCGGPLKPATISFGQAMPERETAAAFAAAAQADLMIVIGSSLAVYPAAALPQEAARAGAALIIVNAEPTGLDSVATVVIHAAAGESMMTMTRLAAISGQPALSSEESGEA